MAINDFTGKNIQDTYQRVVQTDGTNRLADGTGSVFIPVSSSHAITASHALFAVSASHEITFELSSSHAQTADTLGGLTSTITELNKLDGVVSNVKEAYDTVTNLSQGNIRFTELDNGTDDLALTNLGTNGTPEFETIKLSRVRQGFPQIHLKPLTGIDLSAYHIRTINDSTATPGVRFGNTDENIITFVGQEGEDMSAIDIEGRFTGNAAVATVATTVNIIANNTLNESNYITFVDGATGTQHIETDTNLRYNPSTNKLSTTTFNGALEGNASSATQLATARAINGVDFDGTGAITITAAGSTLSDTVTVAKGGTNATSFADKSVIITQDSGTDTLSAVAMSTNGQLLIGGSSGPAVATLTAGNGIAVTNVDGGITIATNLTAGDGLTLNTADIDLDASLTTVTSVKNASLAIGRDDHNLIDFSTDNEIHFKTNNETPVIKMKASGEIEATSIDISGDIAIGGSITSLGTRINANLIGANGNVGNSEYGTLDGINTGQTIQAQLDTKLSTGAQTGITSVLNTSLVVGRDAHNQVDFSTDNEIHFKTNNETPVIKMKASGNVQANHYYGYQLSVHPSNFTVALNGSYYYLPLTGQSTAEHASANANERIPLVNSFNGHAVKTSIRSTNNAALNGTQVTCSIFFEPPFNNDDFASSAPGNVTPGNTNDGHILWAEIHATGTSENHNAVHLDWRNPFSGSFVANGNDIPSGSRVYLAMKTDHATQVAYVVSTTFAWDYSSL